MLVIFYFLAGLALHLLTTCTANAFEDIQFLFPMANGDYNATTKNTTTSKNTTSSNTTNTTTSPPGGSQQQHQPNKTICNCSVDAYIYVSTTDYYCTPTNVSSDKKCGSSSLKGDGYCPIPGAVSCTTNQHLTSTLKCMQSSNSSNYTCQAKSTSSNATTTLKPSTTSPTPGSTNTTTSPTPGATNTTSTTKPSTTSTTSPAPTPKSAGLTSNNLSTKITWLCLGFVLLTCW